MQEDQARTILEKVQRRWFVTSDELDQLTLKDLTEELELFPVEGVTATLLDRAIIRRRIDPRWAE